MPSKKAKSNKFAKKKKAAWCKKYGHTAQQIANYKKKDIERLLQDKGIIRNKLKINAIIYNAQKVITLQQKYGSFKKWLDQNSKLNLELWIKLFKNTFKFTGNEITKEFLISTSYLYGAHTSKCKTYNIIIKKEPIWNRNN